MFDATYRLIFGGCHNYPAASSICDGSKIVEGTCEVCTNSLNFDRLLLLLIIVVFLLAALRIVMRRVKRWRRTYE